MKLNQLGGIRTVDEVTREVLGEQVEPTRIDERAEMSPDGKIKYLIDPSGTELYGLIKNPTVTLQEAEVRFLIGPDGTMYAWEAALNTHHWGYRDLVQMGFQMDAFDRTPQGHLTWAIDAYRFRLRRFEAHHEKLPPILRISFYAYGRGQRLRYDQVGSEPLVRAITGLQKYSQREADLIKREVLGAEPVKESWGSTSKVVDTRGNLLTVYHGTTARFDPSRFRVPAQFSTKRSYAEHLGHVIAVNLNIKNPADLRALHMSPSGFGPKQMEELLAQGYDGAQYRGEAWIAFDQGQIRPILDEFTVTQISPSWGGSVPIFCDPTDRQLAMLVNRFGGLRGVADHEHLWVGEAGELTHGEMCDELGIAEPSDDLVFMRTDMGYKPDWRFVRAQFGAITVFRNTDLMKNPRPNPRVVKWFARPRKATKQRRFNESFTGMDRYWIQPSTQTVLDPGPRMTHQDYLMQFAKQMQIDPKQLDSDNPLPVAYEHGWVRIGAIDGNNTDFFVCGKDLRTIRAALRYQDTKGWHTLTWEVFEPHHSHGSIRDAQIDAFVQRGIVHGQIDESQDDTDINNFKMWIKSDGSTAEFYDDGTDQADSHATIAYHELNHDNPDEAETLAFELGWIRVATFGTELNVEWRASPSELARNSLINWLHSNGSIYNPIYMEIPDQNGWWSGTARQAIRKIRSLKEGLEFVHGSIRESEYLDHPDDILINLKKPPVIKNPSVAAIRAMIQKTREHIIKGFWNPQTNDFWIANGWDWTHRDIADAVGISEKEMPCFVIAQSDVPGRYGIALLSNHYKYSFPKVGTDHTDHEQLKQIGFFQLPQISRLNWADLGDRSWRKRWS